MNTNSFLAARELVTTNVRVAAADGCLPGRRTALSASPLERVFMTPEPEDMLWMSPTMLLDLLS